MRKRSKRSRIVIPVRHESEGVPVPIVADASVASIGIGQDRHIPLLILDTSRRQDIETMVQAHDETIPGDSVSYWTIERRRFTLDSPRLVVEISKPSKCVIVVEFEMERNHGIVVQLILHSKGIYLQPGRLGDRLSNTLDNPRILVEVPPNNDFEGAFRPLYEKALFRKFRERGMNRAQSKRCVQRYLDESGKTFDRISMHRN